MPTSSAGASGSYAAVTAGDDEFGDGYEGNSPFDDDEEEEEIVVAVTSDDDELDRPEDDADDFLEPRAEEAIIAVVMPSPVAGYTWPAKMSKPAMASAPAKKAVKKAPAKKKAVKKIVWKLRKAQAEEGREESSQKAVKKAAEKKDIEICRRRSRASVGRKATFAKEERPARKTLPASKKGSKTRGTTLATKKAAKKSAKKATKKAAKKKKK